MKIIDLVQGTPQWLKWRQDGIGASEIAILMGIHPTKTPLMLFNEKLHGEETFVNTAMREGNEQEPLARAWLEKEFGVNLSPLCAEHDGFSFMRCSYDAISDDKTWIGEIKTPHTEENLEKGKAEVNPLYYHQCQWQMMIDNNNSSVLCIWDKFNQKGYIHHIEADVKLWEKMKNKAHDFWMNYVRRGKEPPLTPKDYKDKSDLIDNPEKCNRFIEIKNLMKELEKEQKEIQTDLLQYSDGENFILHGIKFTKCSGRKIYNMEAMENDGIDISSYLKIGKEYYRSSIAN